MVIKQQKGNLAMSIPCINTIKQLRRKLRQAVYEEMSHQASDWVPEELRYNRGGQQTKPLDINFNVAKKNRIHWFRRTI